MNDTLDGDGGGFAAADAQRRDAAFQIMRFQRVQQRHDQPRAGGADRMAERAGAAIDVQSVTGNAEVALRSHCDYRKSLVDLEQVDISNAPAYLVQELSDRRDRRGGEP